MCSSLPELIVKRSFESIRVAVSGSAKHAVGYLFRVRDREKKITLTSKFLCKQGFNFTHSMPDLKLLVAVFAQLGEAVIRMMQFFTKENFHVET